jgi:hypothetical protein
VELTVIGTGVLIAILAIHYANLWIASLVLLGLSIGSIGGYFLLLSRIDQIAMSRREVLATELCRA